MITDGLGLLLVVVVTAANTGGREAAVPFWERVRDVHRTICLVWADGGHTGMLVEWARDTLRLTLEIVKRSDERRASWCCPDGGWWR